MPSRGVEAPFPNEIVSTCHVSAGSWLRARHLIGAGVGVASVLWWIDLASARGVCRPLSLDEPARLPRHASPPRQTALCQAWPSRATRLPSGGGPWRLLSPAATPRASRAHTSPAVHSSPTHCSPRPPCRQGQRVQAKPEGGEGRRRQGGGVQPPGQWGWRAAHAPGRESAPWARPIHECRSHREGGVGRAHRPAMRSRVAPPSTRARSSTLGSLACCRRRRCPTRLETLPLPLGERSLFSPLCPPPLL